MKDTHVLAAACGVALIAIVCVFIGYATETLPKQKQNVTTTSSQSHGDAGTQTATSSTEKTTGKKKDCACCSKNMEELKDHIQQLRASENTAQKNIPISEKKNEPDSP